MAPAKRILIIANPISGRGRGKRVAEKVSSVLRARGVDVTVCYTTCRGEARIVAQQASGDRDRRPDSIVACGGDGTVQEVADALAQMRAELGAAGPALGIAPAGRCNDFARALKIPSDTEKVAQLLLHGQARGVDLGRVNGRHFCTVATVGIDAEVSSFVDSMDVPLSGTTAYLYGALCVVCRYRPKRLRIAWDAGRLDQPLFLASSANTASYGGAIPIAPGAVPTDGQLDLCLIESVSKLRALKLVAWVLAGRHRSQPGVHLVRTQTVRIEADEPLALWADGERIGTTPAVIEVVPKAVFVMLPAAAAEQLSGPDGGSVACSWKD